MIFFERSSLKFAGDLGGGGHGRNRVFCKKRLTSS